MNTMPLARLQELVNRFLAGDDSQNLVSEIEGVMIECFYETDAYEGVGQELASYNPSDRREEFLVNAEELRPKLEEAVKMLAAEQGRADDSS